MTGLIAALLALVALGLPLATFRLISASASRGGRVALGVMGVAAMAVLLLVAVSLSSGAFLGIAVGGVLWLWLVVRALSGAQRGQVGRPLSSDEVDRLLADGDPQQLRAVIDAEQARRNMSRD